MNSLLLGSACPEKRCSVWLLPPNIPSHGPSGFLFLHRPLAHSLACSLCWLPLTRSLLRTSTFAWWGKGAWASIVSLSTWSSFLQAAMCLGHQHSCCVRFPQSHQKDWGEGATFSQWNHEFDLVRVFVAVLKHSSLKEVTG